MAGQKGLPGKGSETPMEKQQMLGRILVAIALIVFGVQHFIYGGFVAGLVPEWMVGRLFWAYFVGVAFFAAAVGILYEKMARPAATMLGVMFFLFLILLHIPRIVAHSNDGNEWTSGFVALAMCGLAWVLASASPLHKDETADPFLKVGRYFFAAAFLAFGIQHFVYAKFGAGLGPPWFLGKPIWACLTGVVFVATGAAIFMGKQARTAASLLGAAVFLFFLLLHLPHILAHVHNPGPWTSGFEVLALYGGLLVMVSALPKEETKRASN